jgi:hypothetical protein
VGKRNSGWGAPNRRARWLGFGGGRASAGWAKWPRGVGELGRGALLGRARRPHKGGAGGPLGEREGVGPLYFLFIYLFSFLSFFCSFLKHVLVLNLSERKSLTGWRNAPALNPKMWRGLSVLPVRWKREEHKNTQGFRVVRATGA